MTLHLEILSTTAIKRKKPWSRVTWLGIEKEQVVLLDSKRISYLELHNGETKRSMGQLGHYLENINKLFLQDDMVFGFLVNGDILIWNKDLDVIYSVKGLPDFVTVSNYGSKQKKGKNLDAVTVKKHYDLVIKNDLSKIVAIVDFIEIHIWHGENTKLGSPSNSKKPKELCGSWFSIPLNSDVSLSNMATNRNGLLTARFNPRHQILPSAFQCIFSYSLNNTLHVPILTVTESYSNASGSAENHICTWRNFSFQMKDFGCQSIPHSGSLVSKLSNDGLCLALAVNQLSTEAASLLFISTLNGSLVVTNLKNYAVGQPVVMRKKYLWISEMAWSPDDCFLVSITREGSVSVASRMGELLQIYMSGCSLKLGPATYLNLYPLVKPASKDNGRASLDDDEESLSTISGTPNFKQQFSITSHKKVPFFLLTDGYLVSLLQFPKIHSEILEVSTWFLQQAKSALHPFQVDQNFAYGQLGSYSKNTVKSSLNCSDIQGSWKLLPSALSSSASNGNCSMLGTFGGQLTSTSADWENRQLSISCSSIIAYWNLMCGFNNSWNKQLHSLASKAINVFTDIIKISLFNDICFSSQSFSSLSSLESVMKMMTLCFESLMFDCLLYNMLSSSVILLNKVLAIFSNQNHVTDETFARFMQFLLKMEMCLYQSYKLKNLQNIDYFSQTEEEEMYMIDGFYSCGHFNTTGLNSIDLQGITTFKRLKPAWFSLYKLVTNNYHKCLKSEKWENIEKWQGLLCAIQEEIQNRGWELSFLNTKKLCKIVEPANKLYFKGNIEKAIDMWMHELKSNGKLMDVRKLHCVLYAFLSQYHVAASLSYVLCIMKGDFLKEQHTSKRSSDETNKRILYSVIKQMDSKSVTSLLQTYARFLLLYFNKKTVYIYPVHRPHSFLNSKQVYRGLRFRTLVPSLLSDSLTTQKVDVVINPTLVVELLLLGGLWVESVAFLFSQSTNNTFRVAFAIAATWWKTNTLIWQLRSNIFKGEMEPKRILLDELSFLSSVNVSDKDFLQSEEDSTELVTKIRDIVLPGVLSDIDLAPTILNEIVEKLVSQIQKINLFVSNEIFLPAPPCYCPQQTIGYEEGDMPSGDSEEGFRHSVATLIERFFCVVQASCLGFPLMAWCFSFIEKLWAAAGWNSFGETSFSNLQYAIVTFLDMNNSSPDIANAIQWSTLEMSESGQKCLQSMRELFSLIWMLHCRDELSLACRDLSEFMVGNETRVNKMNPNQYFIILDRVLFWAEKLSPFRRVFSSQSALDTILFKAANEINMSQNLARRIARCFPDSNSLSLSGQNQLLNFSERWNGFVSDATVEVNDTTNKQSPKISEFGNKTFAQYQEEEMEKRESLNKRIKKQFSKLTKSNVLKMKEFDDFCFELEDMFINLVEPVFHIGILKRLSQSNSEEGNIPFLTTFHQQLKKAHFKSPQESIKILTDLETQSLRQDSVFELIKQTNSKATNGGILSSEIFKFLKDPVKRQSVLFRQPIRAFWSPTKKVVEKFHKLLTQVRHQFKKNGTKRKPNSHAISKWKSTANLLMENINNKSNQWNKSLSTSDLYLNSAIGPNRLSKKKGLANQIPDLVVELQMKFNEDDSLLPYISWILTWVGAKSRMTSLDILPSILLLSLLLECRRKTENDNGRLSLVRVKIKTGDSINKTPKVVRSVSLRDADHVGMKRLCSPQKESNTVEFFKSNHDKLLAIEEDLKSISPVLPSFKDSNRVSFSENTTEESPHKIHSENKAEKVSQQIYLENKNKEFLQQICSENNLKTIKTDPIKLSSKSSPKKCTLPQVYQECWNKSQSQNNENSTKLKRTENNNMFSVTRSVDSFERNSPHRMSVRRKKEMEMLTTGNINQQIVENDNLHILPSELTLAIQDAVRSEIKKSVEEIGLGILGGALGSIATRNLPFPNENMSSNVEPQRPPRKRESAKSVGMQSVLVLPDLSKTPLTLDNRKSKDLQKHTHVSNICKSKSSSGTSSAESDRSDSSDSASIKLKRGISKKSVLHKVPLLKAHKVCDEVSPKRYYVLSDEFKKRVGDNENDTRNYIRPISLNLLKVDNGNLNSKKSNIFAAEKKSIDPEEIRKFVLRKSMSTNIKTGFSEPRKLLSVTSQKPPKYTKSNPLSIEKLNGPHKEKKKFKPKSLSEIQDTNVNNDERTSLSLDIRNKPLMEKLTAEAKSPESCAQLQYNVYDRLTNSKDLKPNSTQTTLSTRDAVVETDELQNPKITRDIGFVTTPSEAELEDERIKVFQSVLESSKHPSAPDDFEIKNDQLSNHNPESTFLPMKPDIDDNTFNNSTNLSLDNYHEDTFNNISSKSPLEDSFESTASFGTKLDKFKERINSMEEVSRNIENELSNSKRVIENVENFTNRDSNLNICIREKSPGATDWRRRDSKMFEHRKSVILKLIDDKYKDDFSSFKFSPDENDNSHRTSRKISFADSHVSSIRALDDTDICSSSQMAKYLPRSKSSEEDSFINPRKMRELYRIYGSRRVPDRILQKYRIEYISKENSSM